MGYTPITITAGAALAAALGFQAAHNLDIRNSDVIISRQVNSDVIANPHQSAKPAVAIPAISLGTVGPIC